MKIGANVFPRKISYFVKEIKKAFSVIQIHLIDSDSWTIAKPHYRYTSMTANSHSGIRNTVSQMTIAKANTLKISA